MVVLGHGEEALVPEDSWEVLAKCQKGLIHNLSHRDSSLPAWLQKRH